MEYGRQEGTWVSAYDIHYCTRIHASVEVEVMVPYLLRIDAEEVLEVEKIVPILDWAKVILNGRTGSARKVQEMAREHVGDTVQL
jgi:hypothetical protein